MFEVNPAALEKLKKIEETKSDKIIRHRNLANLITSGICPLCANRLKVKEVMFLRFLPTDMTEYNCRCEFRVLKEARLVRTLFFLEHPNKEPENLDFDFEE